MKYFYVVLIWFRFLSKISGLKYIYLTWNIPESIVEQGKETKKKSEHSYFLLLGVFPHKRKKQKNYYLKEN